MSIPKLSEAILLGIGVVRERRDRFLSDEKGVPCGCAVGTALYAVGDHPSDECPLDAIRRLWPWTSREDHTYDYPSLFNDFSIARQISLRHISMESRESIAAWIATIEPQDEVVNQPTTMEVVCATK